MKKLVPEELVRLTDAYNREMESRDAPSQIKFTKTQPVAEVMPELVGGVAHYMGNQVRDRNTTLGGVQVYFGLPRINERLFLRTGYIRSEVRLMEKTTILNKFPLAVDYVPLNHKVNIRASYGFNMYSLHSNTVTISSGVSVRMKGRFLITVVPEAEFHTRYAFFPGGFFAYNVHCGILYRSK